MGVRERYEKRKEEEKEEGKVSSYSGVKHRYIMNHLDEIAQSVTGRVNSYLEDHNSYLMAYQNRFANRKGNYEDAYVGDSAKWMETVQSRNNSLDAEANEIISYMDQYKGYLDADWMKQVREAITSTRDVHKSIYDVADKDNQYWSSFGTEELLKAHGSAEEAYKYGQRIDGYSKKYEGKTSTELQGLIGSLENGEEKEWLTAHSASVDYDEKATADLELIRENIKRLEKRIKTIQNHGRYTYEGDAEFGNYARDLEEAEAELEQAKEYLASAERIQTGIKHYYGPADKTSEYYDPEFKDLSVYKSTENDEWYAGLFVPAWDSVDYETINGNENARDTQIIAGANSKIARKDAERILKFKDYLTDEEKAIYNYQFSKYGEDKANEFLDWVEESVNIRKAAEDFKILEGNVGLELLFGIPAGLDQFESGIMNLFSNKDYITPTSTQILSGMVREDLADDSFPIWYNFKTGKWEDEVFGSSVGQGVYDLTTTSANMAPSILTSAVVSYFNPAAGSWVGSALMGGSAAGNAYADALNRGLDKSQAATYGVAIGVSEALLEKALGGISKFGGTSAKITKAVSGIDDALLRWSLRFGGSFASEALEEGLQEILDPIFQNAIFGTDEDVNWSEVAYSALLGGLSAGVFEGNSIRKDINKEQSLKTEYDGKTDALIQEGLESDIDTESFNLAKDYQAKIESGNTLTGAEIRNLLAANQEQIAPKDLKKIQKAAEARLTELGQTKDVQKLAELATKYATGQKLSKADKAFLANNKNGNRVAQELIPENIMSGEYTSEWAEGIGTKQVNKLAYNIKNIVEQMAKPATYKSLTERVGKEEKFNVSESGKATVNGEKITLNKKVEVVDFVRDKETGDITDMIINADGKQVKASEIDYADEDQSYLFSAVRKIENITPADAQVIIRDYDPSSGISVGEYLNGVDEAYTYGYRGYSEADMKAGLFTTKLSDEKAKSAYELGKLAKNSSREAKNATFKRMRTAVEAETEKAVAEGKPAPKPKKMAITYNKGNGVVRDFKEAGIELSTDEKKGGVQLANVLHQLGLGTNFEFFESFESKTKKVKNQKGELVPARVFINDAGVEEDAPAGVYSLSDGTIRIDLNAYNGRGLTLYALSHELTHFIQQWSTEKYEVLAEYLVSTYEKTGLTMHQRVLREQARLKGIRGKDISYNEAYDEVVANAMMKMFDDGKLVERLTELKAKDKNLAMKLWEGFKEILNKLLGVYQSDPGVFNDTMDLMQMKEDFEVLQGMFAEALVDASENFQANLSAVEVGVEPVVENQTIQEHSGKQLSSQETDLASAKHKINTSMTMAEAKRMIETAFKVNNIDEFYEDEYADAEDWLRKAGSDEVEMYIENDFDLQARYINSNEDILNEEYRMADVLEAYLAGTLVGKEKPKPKRLDVSQSTKLEDNRFYSPQKIEDAKATYELAIQKAVGKDANAINRARAEILLFAHNKGAAELLGITQAELNKKLRIWSKYSATARDISRKINAGVAEENRWTGIENSSYINKAKVTNEDIERLVASVEGDSKGYERKYIARVMLAADTHIDYSKLKFKFASSQQVNADHNGGNRVLGFYDDTNRLIEVTHDKPHTVAHEMGHYIDTQWGRDLIGTDSSHLFLTRGVNEDMVRARYGEPGVQFLNNFKLFINSLSDVNQNYNSYYNDRGEIFARFFARFIEWTDNIATGSKYYSYESTMYNDKFTQAQFVEFARLLQEKALLDGKEVSKTGEQYSSQETDIDRTYIDYGDIASEKSAIDNTVARLVSHGKFVEIAADDVEKHKTSGEWDSRKGARQYLKRILKGFLGKSVRFNRNIVRAEAYLTKEGFNHSSVGLNTPEKAAAFSKYYALIANSEYSYSSKNDIHSNANIRIGGKIDWDSFVAVAMIDGKPYPVVFKVRTIDQDIRSQIYKMATKNEIGSTHDYGQQEDLPDALPNYGGTPTSVDKVTQPRSKVKKNSGKELQSSQETDADYLDAVNRGDMETAQKMVDEAAKNAGYTVKGFHGTTADFNIFDKNKIGQGYTLFASQGFGFYFTESEAVANNSYGKGKRVVGAYLKTENPFVFVDKNNQKVNALIDEFGKRYGRDFDIKDYNVFVDFEKRTGAVLSRIVRDKGREFTEFLRENGYDGITYNSYDYDNKKTHTCHIVFEPNQIKSADPVTYDDDGNIIPLSQRFNSGNDDIRHSTQETDNISNRDMLANAFETLAQNSEEYKMIQKYKNHIRLLNEYEDKLSKLNAEIYKMTFGNDGNRDSKKLRELQAKAKEIAGNINRHDKELLNLEASEPLRKVIEQERKKVAQKTKEHVQEIQQNKKLRAEQAEYRHKIRKAVRDLDKLLNRGNKKTNVKEDMKGFVSKALELADYLFQDHVSNDDLIRKGITVPMRGNEAQLVKETEEILNKLYDEADSLTNEEFTRLDAKRKRNLEKLRDLLTAQRNERLRTPVYKLFDDLVTEYASLKNSNQESVKAAYDPYVENFLRSYIGEADGETDSDRKTLLQNMRVADMTTDELWKLYNAYTMVLKSVRDANKLHVKGRTESIDQMVTQIVTDFEKRNIPDKKLAIVARNISNKIGWDYEKLYYALDRIGSNAFTELIMNLANSENIVMRDVIEAAEFRDQIVEKYGFNNWDVNKEIDKEFLDNTGKKFKLTLGQLMSLYAYSRRDGAWDHIEYGGFAFGKAALTNPKPADSYKLSKEQCVAITNTLTKEQKAYVEDMQKFLSETMGAKGNEVSMELYGIKMFNEKNYFPIHIAGDFKPQAKESQAKAEQGFQSMSNAGFTHAQNPNAKAPFVLEDFNDIWADHVNEMSRYHGTVPALEDIRRVMNRSSYSETTTDSTSVKVIMKNHFGEEAVAYFDNLYREANSGAITDKLQGKSKRFLSFFRKGSTAYSLSVWVQQPASIVRAYAMIDRKYFGTKGMGVITSGVVKAVSDKWTKAHTNAYNEMLKYAPGVTMAKEIGGFDTATGGSIRSYLLDTNKSFIQSMKTENLKGKGKALMNKVDNNAIANTPNLADKIAWIEIWNACKRETVAKHKDLATSSEEFMQLVGERFTEVIRATQVYDSIFAKSPMLKSKHLAVQYLVSFMNEPNTIANMAESAVRDLTRGNVLQGLRKTHVLIHSIIFTSILKSMIYAMRDDDEDETYIEKYIEAITGSLMDDFNPLNYIPFARDVWSVAQGYDVERADMAIVSDAISALNNVIKNATKDTDGMTEEELIEFDKKVTEANWKLVESLAGFFGIPVKNVRREIKGVIDHARIASANAGQTTTMSAWDKVRDAVIDSIPFMSNDKSKTDKLYNAIINDDTAYVDRMKDTYKTDESYHNAVRTALRENDPRIKEAALAEINGNPSERVRIARLIISDGFVQDDVVAAINSEVNALTPDEPDSGTDKKKVFYTTENLVREFVNGDTTSAKTAKSDIISTAIANGKTKEQAEKDFMSSVSSSAKKAYEDGWLTESKAKKLLVEYAGEDEEGATSKVNYWTLSKLYPKYKDLLNESRTENYYEYVKPAGISMDTYAKFLTKTNGLANKYDKYGNLVQKKQDQVIDVIDSLPITRRQKNALFLAAGYAESGLKDVPW